LNSGTTATPKVVSLDHGRLHFGARVPGRRPDAPGLDPGSPVLARRAGIARPQIRTGVNRGIRALFEAPTIEQLANRLRERAFPTSECLIQQYGRANLGDNRNLVRSIRFGFAPCLPHLSRSSYSPA